MKMQDQKRRSLPNVHAHVRGLRGDSKATDKDEHPRYRRRYKVLMTDSRILTSRWRGSHWQLATMWRSSTVHLSMSLHHQTDDMDTRDLDNQSAVIHPRSHGWKSSLYGLLTLLDNRHMSLYSPQKRESRDRWDNNEFAWSRRGTVHNPSERCVIYNNELTSSLTFSNLLGLHIFADGLYITQKSFEQWLPFLMAFITEPLSS